jgi:hypothetical protein
MSVKSLAKKHIPYTDLLADGEDPFSTNKVTGWSLNVPIIGTCTPTEVCAETCYYARGATTWRPSLMKQHRLMNSIKADPEGTGDRIVRFAMRHRLDFIRWNGGGDLFDEMLPCIDRVATKLIDVPQWIVSRLPELASRVVPRPNVYLHFSVDKSSWARLERMKSLTASDLQWFWSYQCDKDELPPSPDVAPVIFRHNYDLEGNPTFENDCPLNTSESIVRICGTCRRCFNGEAVKRCKSL